MKKRIIKVSEAQLRETEGSAFKYLDPQNTYPKYNGHTEISVSGNLSGEEEGKPITGDQVAGQISPQSYSRYRMYGNISRNVMREGVSIDNDKDDDGVDDFYSNSELDILGNEKDNDNLTKIPAGVETKLNNLLQAIAPLKPKQMAIVLNKLIESFDFSQLPVSWKRELMKKITSPQSTFNNEQIK